MYSYLNTCRTDPLYNINPLWFFFGACDPRAKLDLLAGNSFKMKRKKTV